MSLVLRTMNVSTNNSFRINSYNSLNWRVVLRVQTLTCTQLGQWMETSIQRTSTSITKGIIISKIRRRNIEFRFQRLNLIITLQSSRYQLTIKGQIIFRCKYRKSLNCHKFLIRQWTSSEIQDLQQEVQMRMEDSSSSKEMLQIRYRKTWGSILTADKGRLTPYFFLKRSKWIVKRTSMKFSLATLRTKCLVEEASIIIMEACFKTAASEVQTLIFRIASYRNT